MTREEIHKAITDFLAIVEGNKLADEQREEVLCPALDQLALAYHFADFKFDETDYPDAPTPDYDDIRKTIQGLFPNYGYYNTPDEITTNIERAKMNVGDAIDDITDIARDLYEVLWCWENTSVEDALWHFKNGYYSHWGNHLRR